MKQPFARSQSVFCGSGCLPDDSSPSPCWLPPKRGIPISRSFNYRKSRLDRTGQIPHPTQSRHIPWRNQSIEILIGGELTRRHEATKREKGGIKQIVNGRRISNNQRPASTSNRGFRIFAASCESDANRTFVYYLAIPGMTVTAQTGIMPSADE